MKKLSLLLTLAMVLSSLSGCISPGKKGETEFLSVLTGEHYIQEWNSDYMELIAKATYPVISLYGDGAEKYPELAKTLESLSAEKEKSGKENFETIVSEGYEWFYDSDWYEPFTSLESVKVVRADDMALSLLFCGYEYRGGMHGIEYFKGENYDVKTGERLKLTDIIKDKKELSKAVSAELARHYADVEFFEDTDISKFMESEYSWTYDYNGITLYFGPYCLAPYAYGTQAVTITYDKYPDVFAKEIKCPDTYSLEMTNGISLFSDSDSDGENERIYYTAWGSETGENGTFRIYIDDEMYEEEIYFYDADVTFIKRESGTYLYAEFSMDNDYRETRIYEIKDKVNFVGEINAAVKKYYFENEVIFHKRVLTNPDDFLMETRTYILSTIAGDKNYSVGDDGMPVSEDSEYKFDSSIELTVMEEFEAEVIKKGKVKDKETIEKGEKLFYIATDNEKYVWFETGDNKILRKEFTKDGYEIFIDGKNSYDVFEGMFFAG